MTPRWASADQDITQDGQPIPLFVVEISATCDSCGRHQAVLGTIDSTTNPITSHLPHAVSNDATVLRRLAETMSISEWRPTVHRTADVAFLPDNVAGFVTEAWECRAVSAFRAVLLLSRSVIEAASKEKGISEGNLFAKIEALAKAGHIRPGSEQVAHAIRVLGNDIAHGDLDDPPTEEDADDILQLLSWVLEDIYKTSAVTQDILRRRRDRRASE